MAGPAICGLHHQKQNNMKKCFIGEYRSGGIKKWMENHSNLLANGNIYWVLQPYELAG